MFSQVSLHCCNWGTTVVLVGQFARSFLLFWQSFDNKAPTAAQMAHNRAQAIKEMEDVCYVCHFVSVKFWGKGMTVALVGQFAR
jgi:hypothetical protein